MKKEYTIDDTYRALMRPSILRIRAMVKDKFGSNIYSASLDELRAFLKQHNWKVSDYIQESKKVEYD